jgi:hypothetical protein
VSKTFMTPSGRSESITISIPSYRTFNQPMTPDPNHAPT